MLDALLDNMGILIVCAFIIIGGMVGCAIINHKPKPECYFCGKVLRSTKDVMYLSDKAICHEACYYQHQGEDDPCDCGCHYHEGKGALIEGEPCCECWDAKDCVPVMGG